MKKLLKTTLLFALVLSLEARENPFSNYKDDAELKSAVEAMQEDMYIKKMQEEINSKTSKKEEIKPTPQKPVEKTYSKKELDAIIKKSNQANEQKTKEMIKKELENVKKEPEQVVYVKPRADIASEDEVAKDEIKTFSIERTVLPFLKISIDENKFIIKTDYKILKKFSLDKDNKLIFDFKAKTNFSTVRESFMDINYKSLVVGNHNSAGFFRVSLELNDSVSKYETDIKEGLITITKK
ncbi:AMIN domain-containing protein [Aliarcobacter thereius]|uniref:Uncharacterized protein n=2 Tax=Aliarcobacter thereius TaxID=544718 RepID=A0A1C0B8P7_9BACT|nr:AMIN domain-containing protein [Aliarcobacter thereius]OCL93705.1 hypothetical protein AAX25_00024 [Aliarcobacter thereius]OCL95111.1 hypothetical protein AA347_00562 [Aliarcobacter thereius LMG 24486]OCL99988.1 hypothetical protein AAX29_01041 [Aliarcobacter thereius]QBF16899.1 AMIN domain-containing protein [Aliarcobacter thereius LMG 24486]TLS94073.1 AMIN domain-containing protein [Aliarcobacter thereius]